MAESEPNHREFYEELLRNSRLRRNAGAPDLVTGIEQELVMLRLKCDAAAEAEERIMLKAEIAHLRALMANLSGKPRRKPPEAGIAEPAIPPTGPLPKQGGAEAPLDSFG